MKQQTIQKLYMFGIMAGVVLIMAGSVYIWGREPQFNGQQIITKEFQVGGERVVINETPPVEIFGADVAVFKPTATLYKWQDETFIKVWLDEAGDDFATEKDGKVVWHNTDKSKEVNLYPTTFEGNEAFEYEVILKKKPATNVISLKIETQGLDFFYQPELTQEEIDRGNFRPENIVGSYAIYHSTQSGDYTALGGKNYMAGKAFHIYRPRMCDSNNWCVWGDFNKDLQKTKILSITIPQDFLDKAVYPIKKASGLLFGYDTVGGSYNWSSADLSYAYSFTSPADTATGVSISVYVDDDGVAGNFKGVLWDSSTRNVITNGVGAAVAYPTSYAWTVSTFGTAPTITPSTVYIVGFIPQNTNNVFKNDTGGDINLAWNESANSYTSPTQIGTLHDNDFLLSIYVTYTAAAAEEAPPINQTNIIIWED